MNKVNFYFIYLNYIVLGDKFKIEEGKINDDDKKLSKNFIKY